MSTVTGEYAFVCLYYFAYNKALFTKVNAEWVAIGPPCDRLGMIKVHIAFSSYWPLCHCPPALPQEESKDILCGFGAWYPTLFLAYQGPCGHLFSKRVQTQSLQNVSMHSCSNIVGWWQFSGQLHIVEEETTLKVGEPTLAGVEFDSCTASFSPIGHLESIAEWPGLFPDDVGVDRDCLLVMVLEPYEERMLHLNNGLVTNLMCNWSTCRSTCRYWIANSFYIFFLCTAWYFR